MNYPPPEAKQINAIAEIEKYQLETLITAWASLKNRD